MSRIIGENILATMGNKKSLTVTYATPKETLLSTPEVLPSSQPADPQISYTIQSDDFPTMSGNKLISCVYLAYLYVSGYNSSTSSMTLFYTIKKNDAIINSGSNTCVANQYWTLNIFDSDLKNIAVGDVLDIYLYTGATTNLTWDYKALFIHMSRPYLEKYSKIITDLEFGRASSAFPSLTLGNPSCKSTNEFSIAVDGASFTTFTAYLGTSSFIKVYKHGNNFGLGYVNSGDYYFGTYVYLDCSATYHPYYRNNHGISFCKWRTTSIEL